MYQERLINIIKSHTTLMRLFDILDDMDLDYYIGAGVVTQNVWNHKFGLPQDYGVSDIDVIFYHDNLTEAFENQVKAKIEKALGPCQLDIDVVNEKRVHLWYEEAFGYPIDPYESCEDAIDSWPTTATSLGIRRREDYEIYAPFGLKDVFEGVLRPNKKLIDQATYDRKVAKWTKKWPDLKVEPW